MSQDFRASLTTVEERALLDAYRAGGRDGVLRLLGMVRRNESRVVWDSMCAAQSELHELQWRVDHREQVGWHCIGCGELMTNDVERVVHFNRCKGKGITDDVVSLYEPAFLDLPPLPAARASLPEPSEGEK